MKLQDPSVTIHHTALCVHDFDRALTFYEDFLGFVVEGEMDYRDETALGVVVGLPDAVIRWAMLRLGNHRIELFKYYTPAGETAVRRQCDVGYTHLGIQVADVDAVYTQAIAAGYQTLSPPQWLRGGRTRVFYLCEPEGAITEFMQITPDPAGGDSRELQP